VTDRETRDIDTSIEWTRPWRNLAEITERVDHTRWTLFGGLMVQLHVLASGKDIVRPTVDVDMLIHIEKPDIHLTSVAGALKDLGYAERQPVGLIDDYTEHRWTRPSAVGGAPDQIDILVAEHAAPRAYARQGRRSPPRMEGATQALQRTFNARLRIIDGQTTTISVPDQLGALILKAAAGRTDRRPDRHLQDAVALLACLDDPITERERLKGSDRSRLVWLTGALGRDLAGPHWAALAGDERQDALDALDLLLGD
jgi:hypothetical protein